MKHHLPYIFVACLVLAALTACGVAVSGSQSNAVSSTISSVSALCNPSTVAPNATSQCNAKVQGTGNYSSAVAWLVSAGTITSSGLFTAPASAGSVTVAATSTQDPT